MDLHAYDAEPFEDEEAGLSLVEVMVVIVIIGVLATIITINVLPMLGNANRTAAQAQVSQLAQGVETYRLTMGRYPTTEEGLEALVVPPQDSRLAARWPEGGFLSQQSIPDDPWGGQFQYLYPGEHGRFDIWTFGADGRAGGEGEDADIGNWDPDAER
ncbi:MAG: type II secretion system major pseudopilin GspG [Oceanicaulis sp.]